MSEAQLAASFENLPLPRKDMPAYGKRYRVYKAGGEFVIVAANTALEAIRNSAFENIHRIELESLDANNVLTPKQSAEILLGGQVDAAVPPAADTPPPEAAAAAPAANPA